MGILVEASSTVTVFDISLARIEELNLEFESATVNKGPFDVVIDPRRNVTPPTAPYCSVSTIMSIGESPPSPSPPAHAPAT